MSADLDKAQAEGVELSHRCDSFTELQAITSM